jgi:hypothetical protein
MLTREGRWAAVQDTNAHKRGTLCNTHAHKARAAATHYIDISIRIVALSILPAEDVVVAMSVSCVWDVAGDGSGFLFFIKTYARVYVSAARAAIFLSKVRLLVPSYNTA